MRREKYMAEKEKNEIRKEEQTAQLQLLNALLNKLN